MPKATNRRAVLGAVLAAGAVAATALPASALGAPPLSAVDRRVLDLWRRRRAVKGICDRLCAEWTSKEDSLPTWAQSGPVYLRLDGSPAGLPAMAGWPVVVDLSRRPVVNGIINARPNAADLYGEFCAAKEAVGWTEATHEFARALGELSDRLRQQLAEEARVGIKPNDDSIREHAYDVLRDVEDKIEAVAPASVLALGATLIPESNVTTTKRRRCGFAAPLWPRSARSSWAPSPRTPIACWRRKKRRSCDDLHTQIFPRRRCAPQERVS
jgi:hypothetical protein